MNAVSRTLFNREERIDPGNIRPPIAWGPAPGRQPRWPACAWRPARLSPARPPAACSSARAPMAGLKTCAQRHGCWRGAMGHRASRPGWCRARTTCARATQSAGLDRVFTAAGVEPLAHCPRNHLCAWGCGPSRGHAVRALQRMGIGCVVATSFGDTLHGKCCQNGVMRVTMGAAQAHALLARPKAQRALGQPGCATVNLVRQTAQRPGGGDFSVAIKTQGARR